MNEKIICPECNYEFVPYSNIMDTYICYCNYMVLGTKLNNIHILINEYIFIYSLKDNLCFAQTIFSYFSNIYNNTNYPKINLPQNSYKLKKDQLLNLIKKYNSIS